MAEPEASAPVAEEAAAAVAAVPSVWTLEHPIDVSEEVTFASMETLSMNEVQYLVEYFGDIKFMLWNLAPVCTRFREATRQVQTVTLRTWKKPAVPLPDDVLMPLLDQFYKVTNLAIPGNNLGPEGLFQLVNVLDEFPDIVKLDIGFNNLGSDGGKGVAAIIQLNQVTHLNVQCNMLGTEGAKALAPAVGRTGILDDLDLSSNYFFAAGSDFIADAIMKNRSLHKLSMAGNSITSGVYRLVEAIQRHKNLTSVDLARNRFPKDASDAIVKAMEDNPNLEITGYISAPPPVEEEAAEEETEEADAAQPEEEAA